VAPSGQYHADRLNNIGSNRWAFKPEVVVSWPVGDWFAEASLGAWFFTPNDDVLGSRKRSQRPLAIAQLHSGYQFRPDFWMAGDQGLSSGGTTTVDGVANADRRSSTRYGLTLALFTGLVGQVQRFARMDHSCGLRLQSGEPDGAISSDRLIRSCPAAAPGDGSEYDAGVQGDSPTMAKLEETMARFSQVELAAQSVTSPPLRAQGARFIKAIADPQKPFRPSLCNVCTLVAMIFPSMTIAKILLVQITVALANR